MPSYLTGLECIRCGEQYPADRLFVGCRRHSGKESTNLTPTYDYEGIKRSFSRRSLADRPPKHRRQRLLSGAFYSILVTAHPCAAV